MAPPLHVPTWRSLLYVPVVADKFVAKAHTRGADAIILELEDAVAPAEKMRARTLVTSAAAVVGQAGADVLVRINRPWRLAFRDLEAVVDASVRGLVLPKVDAPEHVQAIAEMVSELERERGLSPGHTLFFARVEGAAGLLRVAEIAQADPRVVALGLGAGDFSLATGMTATSEGLAMANYQVVVAANAAGRVPLGLVSTIVGYGDLAAFRESALRSRALGLRGAPCVHPAQVPVLNEVFSPTQAELEHARKIVVLYEAALAEGRGAIGLDGALVDIPLYDHAKRLLAQWGSDSSPREPLRASAD
jgi:citrate lyase subunit beta/citryl-CoA lyase